MITAGQRFGRLTALRHIPRRWVCRCDCGECAAFTTTTLKHARQCPVCTARDTLHARTTPLLTPEEQQMLFSLSISPAGAYLFTPHGGGPTPPTSMGDFDFKNGVYTFDGSTVTVADFFAENLDWGSWSPANIVAGVGLVGNGVNTSPVFTGATEAFVLAGATYIADYLAASDSIGKRISVDTFDLPDYTGETDAFSPGVDTFASASVTIGHNTANTGQIGANRTAFTVLYSHAAISLNGGAVASDTAAGVIPNTVACSIDDKMTLTRLRIYPMAADADLPALSA